MPALSPRTGFQSAVRLRPFCIQDLRYAQRHIAHPAHQGLRQRQSSGILQFLGKRDQRRCVGSGARSLRQNHVVASHLTLKRQATFNPPDGGVKEEHGFRDLLDKIGPIIPAAKMCELMEQNYLDLLRRELGQKPCRENNGRMKEADCCRNGYVAGNAQLHLATTFEVSKDPGNRGVEASEVHFSAMIANLTYPPEPDAQPDKQQTGTDGPGSKQKRSPGPCEGDFAVQVRGSKSPGM